MARSSKEMCVPCVIWVLKVSIFLKDKVQSSNGRFILPQGGLLPYAFDVPGTIRLFNPSGSKVSTDEFPVYCAYKRNKHEGSYDLRGDRVTKLGHNMYSVVRPADTTTAGGTKSSDAEPAAPNPMARAQLDLLSKLIGGGGEMRGPTGKKPEFRLNLFNTDEEEVEAQAMRPVAQEAGSRVINIDASRKKKSAELDRIMGELAVEEGAGDDTGPDLLDLMDSAE